MVADLQSIQRDFERMQNGNAADMQKMLKGAVDIKEKDGKSYWLWMEVDPKVGSMVRAAQAWLTPKLNNFAAPAVGKVFEAAARSVRANDATAKTANTVGQSAFLWSTVFMQQISDMATNSADFKKHRNELFRQFKPIVDATGCQLGTNEVMQTEYERANKNFWASCKGMAGDLVTLVPNVMIAANHQNRLLGKEPPKWSFGGKKEEAPKHREPEYDDRYDYDDGYHGHHGSRHHQHYRQPAKPEPTGDEKAMNDLLSVTAMASPIVNTLTKTKLDDSPTAWQMIRKVRSEVDAICSRKGECEFTAPDPKNIRVEGEPLSEYILSIFQQNEKNRGRDEIAGVNLERLQEASEYIADAIAKGKVDASALVVLVGEHKVITHNKDGETRIAAEEDIEAAITQMAARLGKQSELSADEFFKAFTNPDAIRQQVKHNLESMQGLEKACFITMLPAEVLKQAGVTDAQVREARVKARDHMYAVVDTYMHSLAEAVENASTDELHKLGMTKRNVKSLQRFVEAMDGEHKDLALQSVVDGHRKEMMAMMASVLLNEQRGDEAGMRRDWAALVANPRPPKKAEEPAVDGEGEEKEARKHASKHDKKKKHAQARDEDDFDSEHHSERDEESHADRYSKSSRKHEASHDAHGIGGM